ncbi:hypothetical protein PENTCL1PPCAC_27078 [Pristionchus entomophagus]|uniref:SET domain-containing protein n=1 Tax=Pristionchus entomophagus TaxID=358040 RepID=A0AAV5UEV9_9BILA|nr:hypothetical protein PENTCL1PPCAC_27078 [Pristionchus entomophagus]
MGSNTSTESKEDTKDQEKKMDMEKVKVMDTDMEMEEGRSGTVKRKADGDGRRKNKKKRSGGCGDEAIPSTSKSNKVRKHYTMKNKEKRTSSTSKYNGDNKQKERTIKEIRRKARKSSENEGEEMEEFAFEKEFGLFYPGKVYALKKENGKKERKELRRVQDILKGARENKEIWDDRAMDMADANEEFEIDFVVASTDPKVPWSTNKLYSKLLIVYKGFPRGEWVDYDKERTEMHPAIREFTNTQIAFDKVEKVLREECTRGGVKYEKLYPARYFPMPSNDEVYATSDLAVLRTLQMARQHDLNDVNKEDGVAPLYIADWSGKIYDFETTSINAFNFTNFSRISRRVEKALESGNIEHMDERCGIDCRCSDSTQKERCKCNSKKTKHRIECTDRCKCNSETCSNRIVQRGRQIPLIIMKHDKKGWTTRFFGDVKEGQFIHEYIGEIVTYNANRKMDQTYALGQADSLFDLSKPSNRGDRHPARMLNKGRPDAGYCHRHLVVNGLNTANEARFDSHGCNPNMNPVATFVERSTYGLHRTAFLAKRNLKCGEEATWNYHGEALTAAMEGGLPFASALLSHCDCEEPDCPISKNTVAYQIEHEEDYDSFPDSDEEEERAKEEAKKRDRGARKDKREKERKEREGDGGRKASDAENLTPPL